MSANKPAKGKPPKKFNAAKYNPKQQSNTLTYVLGGLAIVVIVAVVIFVVVQGHSKTKPTAVGEGFAKNPAVTATLNPNGTVRLGQPTAKANVDIYEDALCPYCAELERQYGAQIAQSLDQGNVAVTYHMLNFLDEGSKSRDYSTRAAAASQCIAADGNGPAYSRFHSTLFSADFQPKEQGSSDHTNDDLADMAKSAGASDKAADCIRTGAKVDAAKATATQAYDDLKKAGAQGTPTVIKDGKVIDYQNDTNWVADLNK